MKQLFLASLLGTTLAMSTAALAAGTDLKTLEAAAKAEGEVNSVGMPDNWANWKGTWDDLAKLYGLKHIDTDMSSAQEIAKFKAEKDNASADIGDVGAAFGPIAVKQEVTQPYKPSTWAQVPDWAKDKDGHWALAYTGTIAFIMAKYGMNVIDSGVAVLSMHALWEVANKADIYEAYRGYKAFIERA